MRGKKMFGKGKFGGGMTFKTEIVNGTCPTCDTSTIFVSICPALYRCTNCGSDLEQKVNGVIQYIPAVSPGAKLPVLATIEDGPQKT
jgi:transposase-like protein